MIHAMEWLRRLQVLLRRQQFHDDLKDEMRLHLDLRAEQQVHAGLAPQAARRAANLKFGNMTSIQDQAVVATGTHVLDSLGSDLKYALRQLCKSPGFVMTAVLTLALGIGVNLAIFQLLYGVLFAHLPITHPEQIYSLRAVESPFDAQYFVSYPAYERLRKAAPEITQVLARSGIGGGVLQEPNGTTSRVDFQFVSDNFFQVLGLKPAVGRFYQPGDDSRAQLGWPVILRYSFYKEHFVQRPDVIGQRAVYNGLPIVIIGIAPNGFNGVLQGMAPDLWFPLAAQSTGRLGSWFDSLGPGYGLDLEKPYVNQPQIFWLWVMARIPASSISGSAARFTSALAPDIAMLASATKDEHRRAHVLASSVKLIPAPNGDGFLGKRYSQPLLVLMSMAAVILLVGCLNLANLQMARLEQREKELDIRIALGASRYRILRQVVTESAIISLIGGIAAVFTGRLSSVLLLHWASGREGSIPLDLHVGLAVAMLGCVLLIGSLIAFGLLPAWRATRKSFSHAMKSRLGSSQTRAGRQWSNVMLVSQVSLSLLLLSAALLFTQTLRNIIHIDAGIDREHILTVHMDMDSTGYAKKQTNFPALYNAITERMDALPGVENATVQMCDIPNCGWATAFHVFGNPNLPEEQLHGEENHVGLNYFHTLGIQLLEGRDFSSSDTPKTTKAVILNQTYARQLFGSSNPIGRRIGYNATEDHDFQVIGVVSDARVDGLRAVSPAEAYLSLEQNPQKIGTIEVRTKGRLDSLPADVRDALRAVDPSLPVTEIVPLSIEFEDGLTAEKLMARLTSVFGALTLAMAALGFYGLLSFRVARRRSEIGIRMALGASRTQVHTLFLNQTLQILLAGAIPGIALSIALKYAARKLIYESGNSASQTTTNLIELSSAAGLLVLIAILATLIPAHRAASIDPAETLRSE